jgi:hypothetical protein
MFASILLLSIVVQVPESKAKAPADDGKAVRDSASASPEGAIRAFLLAMISKDAKALRAVALPVDGLDVLTHGQPLTKEQLEGVKAQIAAIPVRVFKAGDVIAYGNGGNMKVKPEDAAPDRVMVMPEGTSFPVLCRKVDGRWKIEAAPIIASFKPARPATKSVDPAQIKDKVSITLGKQIDVQFDQKDDALSEAKVVEKPDDKRPVVHIEFSKMNQDLMLSTQNPFPKDLSFRAAFRLKGSRAYVETSIVPVRAGIFGMEMWRDPIEELVLFDFKLKAADR